MCAVIHSHCIVLIYVHTNIFFDDYKVNQEVYAVVQLKERGDQVLSSPAEWSDTALNPLVHNGINSF